MAKTKEYQSKAVTTSIKASSRRSIGITTNNGTEYFTVELTEERTIPEDADIEKETSLLWDAVNTEVDRQIDDIKDLYKR